MKASVLLNLFQLVVLTFSQSNRSAIINCFQSSLFPSIPPTLRFVNPQNRKDKLSPNCQILLKHLKWGETETRTPSSFEYYTKILNASLIPLEISRRNWLGKIGTRVCTSTRRPKARNPVLTNANQKYNHIPGMLNLGNKEKQWNLLRRAMEKHGKDEFPFALQTFILPKDYEKLKKTFEKYPIWIVKPPRGSKSKGVYLINHWEQVKNLHQEGKSVLIQKFITNPFLVNGRKLELRVYVLVTSISPLRVYASFNCDARLGLGKHQLDLNNLSNPCGNIFAPKMYLKLCNISDWTETLSHTETILNEKFNESSRLRIKSSMEDAIIKVLLSAHELLQFETRRVLFNGYNAYSLLGFDFFVDTHHKVWLNEVNTKPILFNLPNMPDPYALGKDVLNIVGYNLPTEVVNTLRLTRSDIPFNLSFINQMFRFNLTKAELAKQLEYSASDESKLKISSILTDLTADDISQLILLEDENYGARQTTYKRIYPSVNLKKYRKYLETSLETYYFKLYGAWIGKYGIDNSRNMAVARLSSELMNII